MQGASSTKVPRLDKCRSALPLLSKKTHSMWHSHTFSQRDKTVKTARGAGKVENLLKKGRAKQYKGRHGWFHLVN